MRWDGKYFYEKHWLSDGTQSLDNVIYEALKTKTNHIDISSYHVTATELLTTYSRVVNQHPELFYVTGRVTSVSYGDYVSEIYPKYDASYTDEHIKIFNQKVAQIIAEVDPSWPTIEKILYLHDYLVTNITYDMSQNNHNAYNALIDGSCVCEGYSLAFACLLRNIGVNVEVVSSSDLFHAWNLIELNGEYFYIDVTWDDPVDTISGATYCFHNNFMVDRNGLIATGHDSTDWVGSISGKNIYNTMSTSSRYVNYFWKDVKTTIPLIGTKAGYLSEGKFHIYDFTSNTTNSFDRIKGSWKVWNTSNRWWSSDFCALTAAGDAFYYTTEDTVYRVDLNGTTSPVYTLTSEEVSKGLLYGLMANGRNLTYILQTEPDADATYIGTYRIVTARDNFVTRMYEQCLGRTPDQAGLDGWVGQLEGGYMNGAQIAQQFVFSNEMLAKNLSNKEFLMVLYRAMMGREADTDGLNGWVSQLDNKYMTRSQVTKSFVESTEFTDICLKYSIERGSL